MAEILQDTARAIAWGCIAFAVLAFVYGCKDFLWSRRP